VTIWIHPSCPSAVIGR